MRLLLADDGYSYLVVKLSDQEVDSAGAAFCDVAAQSSNFIDFAFNIEMGREGVDLTKVEAFELAATAVFAYCDWEATAWGY